MGGGTYPSHTQTSTTINISTPTLKGESQSCVIFEGIIEELELEINYSYKYIVINKPQIKSSLKPIGGDGNILARHSSYGL